MSDVLPEDERRSVDVDRRDTEQLERVDVSSLPLFDLKSHKLGHAQGTDLDNWDDPNFDPTGSILQDDSLYIEVRSAVTNTDDPMMPSSTFRAWVLGSILAALISGVNQFFYFRYPTIDISGARRH